MRSNESRGQLVLQKAATRVATNAKNPIRTTPGTCSTGGLLRGCGAIKYCQAQQRGKGWQQSRTLLGSRSRRVNCVRSAGQRFTAQAQDGMWIHQRGSEARQPKADISSSTGFHGREQLSLSYSMKIYGSNPGPCAKDNYPLL